MKRKLITVILLLVFSLQVKTQDLKTENNSEPKSTFEVTINGKKYEVAETEELTLDTLLRPKISIKLSAYKKFDNAAISFEYPRNLSYEYTQDFAYKNWTFSGNTAVVLVFELDTKTTISTLVDEMIRKFGKKNCKVEDFQKQLGNKILEGQKLHVSLAGQKLVLECLEIKSSDFKSRFVYFQDIIENNQNSEEYEKVVDIINSSIVFK